MMEDKQIISLYWERNQDAITQTAEKYGNYCTAIARNILQNEEDAEECVNEVWLGAWNSIPPNRPEHLPGFLGKLTRYKAIDRLRAQNRKKRGGNAITVVLDEIAELTPSGDGPEQEILNQELVEAINRFLASLPAVERNVFIVRYWYLEDLAGIGKRFGFSYGKVHSMLHRTRNKLRQYLQEEDLL